MNLLSRIFGRRPVLSGQDAHQLAAWHKLAPADLARPLTQSRCVVVDVETSGLNPSRDRLLAIGAVAVANGMVQLGDSFEIVLQQQAASTHDNILVHGISGSIQVSGVLPVEALLRFLDYLGKAPLVAFHARFDQTMIERALKEFLGARIKQPWLDLAHILPELSPQENLLSLDGWLTRFGIANYARHNALSDAVATAQLFLIAQRKCQDKNIDSFSALLDLEKSHLLRDLKR